MVLRGPFVSTLVRLKEQKTKNPRVPLIQQKDKSQFCDFFLRIVPEQHGLHLIGRLGSGLSLLVINLCTLRKLGDEE